MRRYTKTMLAGAAAIAATAFLQTGPAQAAGMADIVLVVDESQSMSGEHAWIPNMISSLDAALMGAGVTNNRFGMVGFVEDTDAHGPGSAGPHKHTFNGGNDWGTSSNFNSGLDLLLTDNGRVFEDGYEAIQFAIDNYTFRSGAAVNFILITDEDRDDTTSGAITKSSVLQAMIDLGAKLNAVVNNPFFDNLGASSGNRALGVAHDGSWYKADGSGGFTTGTGGQVGNGNGATETDYVNGFALDGDIAGAAWDLTQLRAGGLTAQSFTAAFIDVKVQEIVDQIPEASAFGLLGLGLAGLAAAGRRRKAA
jgi:hypothetical protein